MESRLFWAHFPPHFLGHNCLVAISRQFQAWVLESNYMAEAIHLKCATKIQLDFCHQIIVIFSIIYLLSFYTYKTDYLYLCPSFKREPNFAQTSTPPHGRFLTQVWPCQPVPWPGYPKLQNLNGPLEEKQSVT